MITDATATVRLSPVVVSRAIGDGVIVLDTREGRYFRLNGSAAAIWSSVADQPRVSDLVDAVAALHQRVTSEVRSSVLDFVGECVHTGLLEVGDFAAIEPSAGDPAVRIERSRVRIGDISAIRASFDAQHYIHLPHLVEPSLLATIQHLVDGGEFYDRTHEGIGTELCLRPGIATSVLQLIFNDPALRQFAATLLGGAIGCYDGRVYRLSPREGHYDSWHSDAGEDRRAAVSLNLSPAGYEGGELEMRRTSSDVAEWTVASTGYGSAVMFRIDPSLRHRVIAVRGTRPRTAWAGWFRSVPVFEDLFLPTLTA